MYRFTDVNSGILLHKLLIGSLGTGGVMLNREVWLFDKAIWKVMFCGVRYNDVPRKVRTSKHVYVTHDGGYTWVREEPDPNAGWVMGNGTGYL